MSYKLKPCQCGYTEPCVDKRLSGTPYFVTCPKCGMCTDYCDTKQIAKRIWNNRPIEDEMLEALKDIRDFIICESKKVILMTI